MGHHRMRRLDELLGTGEVHQIELNPRPLQTGYCRTDAVAILLGHLGTLCALSQCLSPLSEKEMTRGHEMHIHLEIPREVRVLLKALQQNGKAFLRAPQRFAVFGGIEEWVADPEFNLPQEGTITGFTKLRNQVLGLFQFFSVQLALAQVSSKENPPDCPLQRILLTGARECVARAIQRSNVKVITDPC